MHHMAPRRRPPRRWHRATVALLVLLILLVAALVGLVSRASIARGDDDCTHRAAVDATHTVVTALVPASNRSGGDPS
jgi:hypothetical protein